MRILPFSTRAQLLTVGLPRLVFAEAEIIPTSLSEAMVLVQIDRDEASMTAGDWVEFETTLQNTGPTVTPPLVAHRNIAAVKRGPYVDPEDWSPDRTRYLRPLSVGESRDLTWKVHALLGGEFAAVVSIVSPEINFVPAVSPPLRLKVAPDSILPIAKVIPLVALVPVVPLALLIGVLVLTTGRRSADSTSGKS